MRITLAEPDTDLLRCMVGEQITLEVTFAVEEVSEGYLSGQVSDSRLMNKAGTAGLSRTSLVAERRLRALRTTGTNA